MAILPPQLKHFLISRAPFALEAAGCICRWSGVNRLCYSRAPGAACRILAYHQTPPEDGAAFRRQMEWLVRNRKVVSLTELTDRLLHANLEGRDLVAVTFDDGFLNNLEVAVPILREFGIPACFFVATDFIDLSGKGAEALRTWESKVYRFTRAAEPMSWSQLHSLLDDGFEIGAHTRSHANLGRLSPEDVRAEITNGLLRIREELDIQPAFFAYPYGKTPMAPLPVRRAVMERGGFTAAFSTERGWNVPGAPVEWLRRDSMEPRFSPAVLEAFLSGVFDRNR